MRRALIIALICVVVVLSLPVGAFYWLCYTESGLHWVAGRAARLKSVQLHIEGLHGRLADEITAERIELIHDRIELTATKVRAHLELHSLLLQTVHLEAVDVDAVTARLKPRTLPPNDRKPRFLPFAWLTVRIDGVRVKSSRLELLNGKRLLARELGADSRISSSTIELDNIRAPDLVLADAATGAPAASEPPHIGVSGAAELRAADPMGLSGDVQWNMRIQGQPQYSGKLHFDGDLAQLAYNGGLLQPLSVTAKGKVADLTGEWRWESQIAAARFNLKPWSPQSGLGNFALALAAQGKRDNTLHVTGRIEPDTIPTGPIAVVLDGAYADRQLRTDKLQLSLANGTQAVAAGVIGFPGGQPALELHGEWNAFGWPVKNAVVKSPHGEFTLTGALPYMYTAQGELLNPQLPPLAFTGEGSIDRERLTVDSVKLRTRDAKADLLLASGALSFGADKAWQITADGREIDPASFDKRYPGKISFHLAGSGKGFEPGGPWEMTLSHLRGELRKQPLGGEARISRSAQVWDIGNARIQLGSAHLEVSGVYDERPNRQPDIRWEFSAADLSQLLPQAHGQMEFSGRLAGTREAPKLSASLRTSGFQYEGYQAGKLQAHADLDLKSALSASLAPEDAGSLQLDLKGADLRFAGQTFESAQVDVHGDTAAHQLKAQARSSGRDLNLDIQGAYSNKQWQGRLNVLDLVTPEARLGLEKPVGLFVGPTHVEIEPFCLSYPPQKVCGWAKAVGGPGVQWAALPLTGALEAQTRELGFVTALVPEIDRASGDLTARIQISGTLGAPQIEGVLALEKGELDLYAVNLLLREVGMRLELAGKTLSLKGQARAGEGSFQVDGKLAWESGAPSGNLDLKGENLLIANVPEARIQASPNISVGIKGREIQVDGAVRVPYARLAPANLTGAMLPSEDEVIVGSPPVDPSKSFRVTTGIHLILGKDVRIDSYGLSGRITGGIAAYTAPDEVSTASGELEIEEGEYSAYGRELKVERGRLIFTGGVMSNPGVDIRASKQFPEILAGINVRGTLRDPRLSFFSEPPLPQTQIASILITGRTFDSLQQSGGPGFGREALLAQGGALLAKQLGGQVGIDDVTVESGANADTSLVLGKYLSPRLYVGYGISLAESINTLKLRYTLGDRWTIKLEAGENKSADVVYAIER